MLLSKYFIIWLKLEKLQIWDCRFADLKKKSIASNYDKSFKNSFIKSVSFTKCLKVPIRA